jgi:hypothetical protein
VPWFVAGDFKDMFTDILIENLRTHINIAHQLHKNERTMGAMQGFLAKMVYQTFSQTAL